MAMFFVSSTTPPFDALYTLPPSVPSIPSTLATVMMLPDRCSIMWRERVLAGEVGAGEVHRDHACPLGRVERVHRPAAGDAGERRHDVDAARARPRPRRSPRPTAASSVDVDRAASPVRSRPTTIAPSSARRAAVASPSPDAAPVTTATLSRQTPHERMLH